MKLDLVSKIFIAVMVWAVSAFIMSIFYYWLKDVGLIWDNPDYVKTPEGNGYMRYEELPFNGRKVIFGIVSLCSFCLLIAKIVFMINKEQSK